MTAFLKHAIVPFVVLMIGIGTMVAPAEAFVSMEDIYIDKGVVEYVNHREGIVQIGEKTYYFSKKGNNPLLDMNISQADTVEIYYKIQKNKNVAVRLKLTEKASADTGGNSKTE